MTYTRSYQSNITELPEVAQVDTPVKEVEKDKIEHSDNAASKEPDEVDKVVIKKSRIPKKAPRSTKKKIEDIDNDDILKNLDSE